jgi:tetratricopeptide (TPR) repeat protein
MAYVFADMDALKEYQGRLNETLSELENQAVCKEDLIQSTTAALKAAVQRAEEAEQQARQALQQAQDQLEEAERQTREHNRYLEPDEPQAVTPQFYYDNVSQQQERHDEAKDVLQQARDTLQAFEDHVRNYRRKMEDALENYKRLLTQSAQFFSRYIKILVEAKRYTNMSGAASAKSAGGAGSPTHAPADSATPLGWCKSNRMSAVQVNAQGQKTVSISIGGSTHQFPCTKSGMESAYRQAVKSGDADMMARTSAMFEIETFRESLGLQSGDSAYPQLGGYHGDVKNQDPPGFESHHIPARSVQQGNADQLPALTLSKADHTMTSSYSGKQSKTYPSFIPSSVPDTSYKDSVKDKLRQGSSGYIDSVKCELLDLIHCTGHRYDGGISAYLDAVIDMLSVSGIPEPTV